MVFRTYLAILMPLLAAPTLWAEQEQTSTVDSELIQTLLAKIAKLEERVSQLEQGSSATPVSSPDVEPETAPPASQVSAEQAVLADVQPRYPNLKFRGFSDFNFSGTNVPGSTTGFREGQFILHMSSPLSRRIGVFSEVGITARPDGFRSSVERIIIQMKQSDYLQLSFGRYHTPINYWNNAFHHGLWLQTSIARPEMVQFGGSFLPVHFVGALVGGAAPSGGLNVNYNFGIGNGRSQDISDGGDRGDINNHKAWLASVFVKPNALYGLQAGGGIYRDKINLSDGRDFREWISTGHLVWSRETPELIFEFTNVQHRELSSSRQFDNPAFYVQAGYRLPFGENRFKPYYRYEWINIDEQDPVFSFLEDFKGSVVGLRYDFSYFAALKAEYRHSQRLEGKDLDGGFMQIAFTF